MAAEVLKKAPFFRYETGTFANSTEQFFIAQTAGGGNQIQFSVSEKEVKFMYAIFVER
jgi:hypothetical protein